MYMQSRLIKKWVRHIPAQGRQFVLKSGGDKDQMKKHYSRTGKILNNGASKMGIA